MSTQLDLDLSEEARHRFECEQAAALEFSEENLCLCWVTQSDGRAWREWWDGLPKYQRRSMLAEYRDERMHADHYRQRMRSFATIQGINEELFQESERLAAKWAAEIKQAAIERRPCPFMEGENMSGFDRMFFRTRLARAFEIAGVVIVEAAREEPDPKRKKKAA